MPCVRFGVSNLPLYPIFGNFYSCWSRKRQGWVGYVLFTVLASVLFNKVVFFKYKLLMYSALRICRGRVARYLQYKYHQHKNYSAAVLFAFLILAATSRSSLKTMNFRRKNTPSHPHSLLGWLVALLTFSPLCLGVTGTEQTYEAEDAVVSNASIRTYTSGYTGTGYVAMSDSDSYVEVRPMTKR